MTRHRHWQPLSLIILCIAAAERIIIYLHGRDLMIDEANLAFNIIDRDIAGFFSPLDHEQYAPPLFLLLQKAAIWIGGVNEYALRLLPLLSSLLFLWWFRQVMLRLTSGFWTTWAMLPAGFSWYFLRYSAELKQYSSDMAIAIGLIYLALLWPAHQLTRKRLLLWTIIGVLSIWTSMPAVFILTGIGMHYLWVGREKWTATIRTWLIPISAWLVSFAGYYFLILRQDIGLERLQAYHNRYFLQWNWWDEQVALSQYQLLQELHAVIFPPYNLVAIVTITGILSYVFVKGAGYRIILLTPVASTLIASSIHQFSLIPRVSLFMFPLLLLVIAMGWHRLLEKFPVRLRMMAMVIIGLIGLRQTNVSYFWQRMEEEPIREAIAYIQSSGNHSEMVIVHHESVPAYRFYTQYHDNRSSYVLNKVTECDWDSTQSILERYNKQYATWLLASHADTSAIAKLTHAMPTPDMRWSCEKAYAYYWP